MSAVAKDKAGVAEITATPAFGIKDPNAGIITLHHNGVTLDLVFDWHVISMLQRDHGKPGYLRVVAEILEARDVDGLADLISRASGRDSPKRWERSLTETQVMDWSPPVVVTTAALNRGWLLALFGPTMRPTEAGEKPEQGKELALATFLKLHFKRLLGLASRGKNSGT